MDDFKNGLRILASTVSIILSDLIGWIGLIFIVVCKGLLDLSEILDPWSKRNTTVESESYEEK